VALKSDGSVLAWGCVGADAGQCTVPAEAGGGVVAIAAGKYHSLALGSRGGVLAWGCSPGNDYGQCTVPAAAGSGVVAIAAGSYHSLALKSNGSVLAWGCGFGGANYGQCTVPAAAGGGVTAIAAGAYHSLAVHTLPTAVSVRSFSAAETEAGALLRWRTASESGTLGFNLYRGTTTKIRLTHGLVHASGDARGHSYSYLDQTSGESKRGLYYLEIVQYTGSRTMFGPAITTAR
jgi:hypothetical protein